MKKIIFILIGIIIGSLLTLGIQKLRYRTSSSFAVAQGIKTNLGVNKVRDLSTDQLFIHEVTGSTSNFVNGSNLYLLQVVSKKYPEIYIYIDINLEDGSINQLVVHDQNNTFTDFMDKDSDGAWDFRSFSFNDILYMYGRGTGYPDIIIKDSNVVVRIDEQYHEMLKRDDKQYITLDGKQVEIDGEKWGYFNIKKSEPPN